MKSFVVYFVAATIVLLSNAPAARADIIHFRATGNAGEGLLAGNITTPTPVDPGSGAIGPSGITYDTDTNALHIDIEWGSENGYTDMSGVVTLVHLHGPTASLPPDAWSEVNTNILLNLGASVNLDNSATGGGLVASYFLSSVDAEPLIAGRTYINVHTELNPMSEIRGYLVAVPEPNGFVIIALAASVIGICSRRRRR